MCIGCNWQQCGEKPPSVERHVSSSAGHISQQQAAGSGVTALTDRAAADESDCHSTSVRCNPKKGQVCK